MRSVMLCLVLFLFALPAVAKKPVPHAVESTATTGAVTYSSGGEDPWLRVRISEQEQTILLDWRRTHPNDLRCSIGTSGGKSLPKGQQKKLERTGQVSVGWQKKIARGEVMPVDIFQQCRNSVPPVVVSKLPPAPAGTLLIEVDGKIVRLMEATREILDVFDLL